jgi:putative flippase GtrA
VITRAGDNLTASSRVLHGKEGLGSREDVAATRRRTALRWLKFNLVGALGIAVQLAVLFGLKSGLHLNYLLATALAVETAVVHNFLWHERYTWADRVQPSWRKSSPRFLRFNLATGGVSIAGNLALMKLLVGLCHVNYLASNAAAIASCSLLNFLLSEAWIFQGQSRHPHSQLAVPPE